MYSPVRARVFGSVPKCEAETRWPINMGLDEFCGVDKGVGILPVVDIIKKKLRREPFQVLNDTF